MTLQLPPMTIGRTGLVVPRLGFGTAPLGSPLNAPDPEALAVETIRYAVSAGLRLIDTSPMYGVGRSERLIGKALAHMPDKPVVLSTKVGRRVSADGTLVPDWTRDGILRGIEESLERLQVDHVDILLIHDPDEVYRQALDVVYPVLADLRKQGVIKAVGAGMNQWQMELQFARDGDFDCFLLAGRYTLLEQTALDEFLPYCVEHQISLMLGGVLNSGILATGAVPGATYNYEPAPPAIQERVRRIEAVCARHDVPLRVAALQFPLAHSAVASLVVGAQSPAEVQANIDALAVPIPSDLWAELRAEGLLHPAAPVPGGQPEGA
jgi:D-threo-aldose 1-dehydrogenase